MKKLETVENRVLAVLKEHPEARNDDMKLYLLISKACIYDTYGIADFSFEDVMSNYKAYGIPCFESIRRTRQKIQAKDRKSTRLNSSHRSLSRMPSSA